MIVENMTIWVIIYLYIGGINMCGGNNLAIRFKKIREKSGFTQAQLAAFLEVDQSFISKFEKGDRKISIELLEKVCTLFGCDLEYLSGEGDIDTYERISVAFRSTNLQVDDLEAIAAVNKIALNMRFINSLLEVNGLEE